VGISIIGCGNIGTALAMFLEKQDAIKITALADMNNLAANLLLNKLKLHHPRIMSTQKAIEQSDLIIEAASPDAVKEILNQVSLQQVNKKILVISTGGLISKNKSHQANTHAEIFFPSGAIAGLDAIKAVAHQIDWLELIT